MPRHLVRMGVFALSAFIAAAALPAAAGSQPDTLAQNLESGIKDAQLKRSQGDYAGAVRTLSQLMLAAPDDPRVVGEYGKVLIQQGRARAALDFLQRAVQLQQRDWTLYSALGVAYDQVGDYQSARNAYDYALSLKPGETAILNNYAMSRMLAGDLPQAKKLIAAAAAGSKDARVARNMKLIGEMTPAEIAAATPAVRHAPGARPAAPVTVKPLPNPSRTNVAAGTPKPLAKPATTGTKSAAVQVAPGVMMQKVPVDPKAGPVNVLKPRAVAAKNKPAVKKSTVQAAHSNKPKPPIVAGVPALRLANDRP